MDEQSMQEAWMNSRCKKCREFAGSIQGYCSVCARQEGIGATNAVTSGTPAISFSNGEFVRIVPSNCIAIFRENRPNNQALVNSFDGYQVVCLASKDLIFWLTTGERPAKCNAKCGCTWKVNHVRITDLVKLDETEARAEMEPALLLRDARREEYWADTTAATCTFKDCANCGHRFCGIEDCQDGSCISGGDWSIKCVAQDRCPQQRNCRWCETVHKVGNPCYGGTGVCCSCKHPKGDWSYKAYLKNSSK